jgi:hypothetical protein
VSRLSPVIHIAQKDRPIEIPTNFYKKTCAQEASIVLLAGKFFGAEVRRFRQPYFRDSEND